MPLNNATYKRKALIIAVAIMLIVGVVQAQNLFGFPYYQDSEGTSVSNAWAVVTEGRLSPYTYSYEEPPLGSFVVGLWAVLSGGLSAFGFSINSGRVLMLGLHLLSVGLVFGIARKTSKSDLVAIIAALVFAFSPLAATLQRRVLVDNISIVWLLASVYLILGDERHLKHYFLSAMLFGLAVLTKGSVIWFIPAFMYVIALKANRLHKRFASGHWLALAIFVISLYPLYAQMKQELFPEGWLLGGDFPHVSLVERLADRGPNSDGQFVVGSGLRESLSEWVDLGTATSDPVIVYAGWIAVVFIAILAIDNKTLRPILAFIIAGCLKLMFGGPVFVSDAILLLPFLAVCIGVIIGTVAKAFASIAGGSVVRYGLTAATMAVFLYPFGTFYGNRIAMYTVDQVEGQVAAVNWVRQNLPHDAVIVTDNYAFVDLREIFANAHHYWKVDTDPALKYNVLDDDVCNIDYLVVTPQVQDDIELYGLDLMRRAIENSEPIMRFANNGWPVEIRQASKRDCLQVAFATDGDDAN